MDAPGSAQTENKLENTKDKLREEIPEAYLLLFGRKRSSLSNETLLRMNGAGEYEYE